MIARKTDGGYEGQAKRRDCGLTRMNAETINGHVGCGRASNGSSELEAQQELLDALLEHTTDQIYFKELDSSFRYCNQAVCQRFEMSRQEVIGKTDFDLFDEEHARPAFQDEQRIVQTGQAVVDKVEREILKTGEQRWALTTKMPLRNKRGEIIGTFGISKDITPLKQAEAKVETITKQLVESSRMAGMAEVATSVLHNVGNVLNSVNISVTVISDKIKESKMSGLSKAMALMCEHTDDLADFLKNDPKGKQLPGYLASLAERLAEEQAVILREVGELRSNVDHINEIVAMQQAYAKVSGLLEVLNPKELVDDALRLNAGAVARHHVTVVREFETTPAVSVDRHKALQILVNLIRNAKHALDERGSEEKVMTLRIRRKGAERIEISVIDNGVGIKPENLGRIFEHGFTTRKNGHGFGLHSGAIAAKELGGSLTARSDGPGRGATFTLELPIAPPEAKA
jgi:PAS domain S-box-containing protein